MYETVSIKVKQQFPGVVSCGEGCYADNWTEWSNEVSIDLSGSGTINDSSVEFVWNKPEPGPDCYPTYPKNKQVNSLFLPFNESEVRQSLLDYGNYYGRLCGDELVNAYINHWKAITADDIADLYPDWSESKLDLYLNGSGNYKGWYDEWNSTPLTVAVAPDTTGPNISNFSVSQNTVEFNNNTDRVSITVSADFSDDSGMINYINFAFIQPDGSWISSDYECAIGANTDVNNGTYSCDMNTSAKTGIPLAMMRIRVVDMSDNWTTLDIPDALTIVYNP